MNKRMTSEALSSALVRAQQGHLDAWEPIFGELLSVTDKLVRQIIPGAPQQDHAESVQQVLTYLWEDRKAWIQTYDATQPAVPYVNTIIRRKTFRILRTKSAQKRKGKTISMDDAEELETTGYVWHELDRAAPDMHPDLVKLVQYIDQLSAEDKDIILRHGLHEESYKEIAADSAQSENTLNQRFLRALKKLGKRLLSDSEKLVLIFLPLLYTLTCAYL